jgi:hypothetical protein
MRRLGFHVPGVRSDGGGGVLSRISRGLMGIGVTTQLIEDGGRSREMHLAGWVVRCQVRD